MEKNTIKPLSKYLNGKLNFIPNTWITTKTQIHNTSVLYALLLTGTSNQWHHLSFEPYKGVEASNALAIMRCNDPSSKGPAWSFMKEKSKWAILTRPVHIYYRSCLQGVLPGRISLARMHALFDFQPHTVLFARNRPHLYGHRMNNQIPTTFYSDHFGWQGETGFTFLGFPFFRENKKPIPIKKVGCSDSPCTCPIAFHLSFWCSHQKYTPPSQLWE